MSTLLQAGQAWVRHLASAGLGAVLPPRCLTCEAGVEAPGRLCPACFRKTVFVTQPCCDGCGAPFRTAALGGRALRCTQCAAEPPPWGRARAALRYDEQARRIILPMKHGDRVENGRALAAHMARAGAVLLREADVLVPVPLHRSRLFTRRYNQAALLAYGAGRFAGRPVLPDALVRLRATVKQGTKGRAARAAAVAGVFAVRPGREAALRGRRVLLVDDVLTTGATAGACARVLLAAGVARVDLLVGARATFEDLVLP